MSVTRWVHVVAGMRAKKRTSTLYKLGRRLEITRKYMSAWGEGILLVYVSVTDWVRL